MAELPVTGRESRLLAVVLLKELRLSKVQDLVNLIEKVLTDLDKPLTADKQKQ